MVMTRSSKVGTRKFKKGSFNGKGRIFYQDGIIMDSINVEPLCSTLLALMPYGTSKEDIPTTDASRKKSPSPIKGSPSVQTLSTSPFEHHQRPWCLKLSVRQMKKIN